MKIKGKICQKAGKRTKKKVNLCFLRKIFINMLI